MPSTSSSDPAPTLSPDAPGPYIDVAANLRGLGASVEACLQEAGRQGESIEIVAVSKTFDHTAILPALEAGHRRFGENRIQEAAGKWPALKERFPDAALHLIGPLQSNKARDAVALFDAIETIDREKIARVLSEEMERQDRRPALSVQVNIGEEPQKSGVKPQEAAAFVAMCQERYRLPIEGLMCIPPADEPPAPYFALAAKIAGEAGLTALSMGMSADYRIAIRQGATRIRVGSGVFGPRG